MLLLGSTDAEDGNDVLIDNLAQQRVWVAKDSVECSMDRETLFVEKMKILYRDGDGTLINLRKMHVDPVSWVPVGGYNNDEVEEAAIVIICRDDCQDAPALLPCSLLLFAAAATRSKAHFPHRWRGSPSA